ncbi:MAG: glycosyltransferase [Planctomycetota bacterium]
MKPCVIIPTYNNAGTLEQVVRETRALGLTVFVVDDGSSDGTRTILERIDGITVLRHGMNRGKGAALRTGLLAAKQRGFTHAVSIDSDGQHLPGEIPRFLEEAERHPGALLLGNRDLASARAGRGSRFGRAFSNFWTCVETGRGLPDTQTGFRLYPLDSITSLHLEKNGYDLEIEVLVKAIWTGVPVRSIPVSAVYLDHGERVSHFRPGLDFLRIGLLNTGLVSRRICFPGRLRARLSQEGSHRFSLPVLLSMPLLALVLTPVFLIGALRLDAIAIPLAASLAGSAVLLWFLLRRAELLLAALVPVGLAMLFALGWAGYAGADQSFQTVSLLGLLFTLQAGLLAYCQLHRFRTGQDHSASAHLLVALSSLCGGSLSACAGTAACLLTTTFFFRALLIRAGANGTPALRNIYTGFWVFRLMVGRGLKHMLTRRRHLTEQESQRTAIECIRGMGLAIRDDLPIGRRRTLGEEKIDPTRSYVVVCNHESMYDITAILALPLPIQILVKSWVWKTPVMGAMAKRAGYLLARDGEAEQLLASATLAAERGFSLLVFPEGTRTRTGKMGRFHNGAFAIARSLNVPVLPICLVNTREVVPRNAWWVGDHDAILSVLDPIEPGDFEGEGADRRMAKETRDRIRARRDELWLETQGGENWKLLVGGLFRHLGSRVARAVNRELAEDALLEELPRICDGTGPLQVVGSGKGVGLSRLVLAFPERPITAIEADPARARSARTALLGHYRVDFQVGDLASVQYEPAEWSVLLDALDRETNDRRQAILTRLAGALDAGARLLLRVRDQEGRSVGDWIDLLEKTGFKVSDPAPDLSRNGRRVMVGRRE